MAEHADQLAATSFDAWQANDFPRLRSVLADDVTFVGPLAQLDNADACVKGLEGMAKMMTDLVIEKRFVDGPDVITWFELHTAAAPPVTVANWIHAENGKITRIRVTFDPRPLLQTS